MTVTADSFLFRRLILFSLLGENWILGWQR